MKPILLCLVLSACTEPATTPITVADGFRELELVPDQSCAVQLSAGMTVVSPYGAIVREDGLDGLTIVRPRYRLHDVDGELIYTSAELIEAQMGSTLEAAMEITIAHFMPCL